MSPDEPTEYGIDNMIRGLDSGRKVFDEWNFEMFELRGKTLGARHVLGHNTAHEHRIMESDGWNG